MRQSAPPPHCVHGAHIRSTREDEQPSSSPSFASSPLPAVSPVTQPARSSATDRHLDTTEALNPLRKDEPDFLSAHRRTCCTLHQDRDKDKPQDHEAPRGEGETNRGGGGMMMTSKLEEI